MQEIPIKSEALALEGTQPAVGDEVEVRAVVTRIEGTTTYVRPTEEFAAEAAEPAATEPDADDLRGLAADEDAAAGLL